MKAKEDCGLQANRREQEPETSIVCTVRLPSAAVLRLSPFCPSFSHVFPPFCSALNLVQPTVQYTVLLLFIAKNIIYIVL